MVACALAGCAGPLSTLDPAGPAARGTAWLFWVMLAVAVASTLLVSGLFAAAMSRRRRRDGPGERTWILGFGVAFPLAVIALLLGVTLLVGRSQFEQGRDLPVVRATAMQWAWRFNAIGADGRPGPDLDRLVLVAGQPTIVELVSEDVIHGFWVPRLGGKMDAVPGIRNRHLLTADAPGRYAGICAEYCGKGHDQMRFEVEVLPAAGPARTAAGAGPDGGLPGASR